MMKGGGKQIVAAAEGLGAPIVRIVLTHAHGDHIGAVDELAAALPGAEVMISARDARLCQGHVLGPGRAGGQAQRQLAGRRDGPTRTVGQGERSARWRSSPRPATRRATSRCSTRATARSTAATSTPPSAACQQRQGQPALPARPHGHVEPGDRLESARALRALEPARLAPGHGKLVDAPAAAMDAAIAKAG